jgi:hypothetical protein
MKARLLLEERHVVRDGAFAELVVWQLPKGGVGSKHRFKYRLAFVVDGACVLRYDNEHGKGDHRHIGAVESPYHFTSPEQLIADFWRDIDDWSL